MVAEDITSVIAQKEAALGGADRERLVERKSQSAFPFFNCITRSCYLQVADGCRLFVSIAQKSIELQDLRHSTMFVVDSNSPEVPNG